MSTDLTTTGRHEIGTVISRMPPGDQFRFCDYVAGSTLVPVEYRGRPENVLLAVTMGESIGLTWAEAMQRIHVIEGRLALAAELTAAQVRGSGHRLRLAGDDRSATATIIRRDDPEFAFEVTRTIDWAERMGYLRPSKTGKPTQWHKDPATMLQWRAVTACAKRACPEALWGMGVEDWTPDDEPAPAATAPDAAEVVVDAEIVEDTGPVPATRAHQDAVRDACAAAGITDRRAILAEAARVIGRPIKSARDLTCDEAEAVIVEMQARIPAPADAEVVPADQSETIVEDPPGWLDGGAS